ncbi:MAG: branched-chain amino acid ABC transporter permease [Alphaproteobacteria bacterium]|nr:branched-chain amino acid ABC transporter permease [Alphaproteobacteria bacterium]MBF0355360.1 branched-chain amino acid ABC transporter permease [Alphaproteobacteria bacterium]
MDTSYYFIQALNGIQYGFLLFLVASGLTLIFGIMGIINLAHGSFYMIGAYLCWWLTQMIGNLFLGIVAGVPLVVLLGLFIERFGIIHLYKRDHLYQVLFTFGLILIFNEMRSVLWGNEVQSVQIPEILSHGIPLTDVQSYPVYRLFISLVCMALAAMLYLVVQRTRLGMTIRAGASNREMVQALGIDIVKLFAIVFAMGAALAAFAGMVSAPVQSVFPGMGDEILIVSLVVVVVGGVGSIKGAFLGAMLIGMADTFGAVFLPHGAGIVIYAVMAIVLLWRPQGLFGRT